MNTLKKMGAVAVVCALILAFSINFMEVAAESSNIIFVNHSAAGDGTGTTWADAFTNLQEALQTANAGDEIWVAKGVYYPGEAGTPVENTDRTATFTLKNGVALYGGFSGTETQLAQRNWRLNKTVLSGDLDRNDTVDAYGIVQGVLNMQGYNAYCVVTGSNIDSNAILDGFVITGGFSNERGGGMYISNGNPVIRNVSFITNRAYSYGGGVYTEGTSEQRISPTFINVEFRANITTPGLVYSYGGAVYNRYSNALFINCTLSGNASQTYGGAVYNVYSDSIFVNSTFCSNYTSRGGAIYSSNSNPQLINSIFYNNFAGSNLSEQEDIYNAFSSPTFTNCIIKKSAGGAWIPEVGIDGGENFYADPLFANRPSASNFGNIQGDLRLQNNSPAIDKGINQPFGAGGYAEGITKDLDEGNRIYNGIVDLGAYEYHGQATTAVVTTTGELAAALGDANIVLIEFGADIQADINANRLISIDFADFSLDGNLHMSSLHSKAISFTGTGDPAVTGSVTVDAPNASVTNHVKVGGTVTVKDVSGTTWEEYADGNDLVIDIQSGPAKVKVYGNVNSLTVNGSGAGLEIIIDGTVQTAIFNAPAVVEGADNITTAHIAAIDVELDESPQFLTYAVSFAVAGSNGSLKAEVDSLPITSGDAVEAGKDVVFTAAPAAGYKVKDWKVYGYVIAGEKGSTFTIEALDSAIEITVEFVSLDYQEEHAEELPRTGGYAYLTLGLLIAAGGILTLGKKK